MKKTDPVSVADSVKNRTRIWLMLRAAQRTALPDREAICEFIRWEKPPAWAEGRATLRPVRS